jgi:hypothetical protein
VLKQSLTLHFLTGEESQFSWDARKDRAYLFTPDVGHRIIEQHFFGVYYAVVRDNPDRSSSTLLPQELNEFCRSVSGARWDRVGKAVIQPLEMREFVGELSTMLWMAQEVCAAFPTILQDERSNHLLLVQ